MVRMLTALIGSFRAAVLDWVIMDAASEMKRIFLLRTVSVAILGTFIASGCRSATDASAVPLPIVFYEGGLTGHLVLMSADGTVRRELLNMPDAFAKYLRWSPDGQKIVFRKQAADPRGPGGLFIINSDGSGLREMPVMAGADWSPDGTRLVGYSGSNIAVVGQDGTGFTLLPPTNVDALDGSGISWSPDGKEILYNGNHIVGTAGSGADVWILNILTGVSRVLAPLGLDARWSPDGRRVAYIATDAAGQPGNLNVINSDGSNPRTLAPATSVGVLPEFAWSPGGERLLFSSGCCDATGLWTITVVDLQSTNITTSPGNFAHYPDWQRAP